MFYVLCFTSQQIIDRIGVHKHLKRSHAGIMQQHSVKSAIKTASATAASPTMSSKRPNNILILFYSIPRLIPHIIHIIFYKPYIMSLM